MVLKALELYHLLFLLVGLAVVALGLLPRFLETLPLSEPPFFALFGFLIVALPLGVPAPDPFAEGPLIEHVTELGVIVALMTAGLKLDRPPGLRSWESTWRLLAVTMPLTIALAALVGWWAGLAVPTAALLGACIAPTDPVLASEIQVEGPQESPEDELGDEEASDDGHGDVGDGGDGGADEVRFALTSEAGLNDGFAFPFTNLAIAMAMVGAAPGNWLGEWLLVDVAFRGVVALAVGLGLGYLLARVIFYGEVETENPLAESLLGVEALGATLVVYGTTEFLGGYGFIAVFVAAVTIRRYEEEHAYYEPLHEFSEQAENLLMVGIMLLFGGLIAGGLFAPLNWQLVVAALVIVFVVRPVSGLVALIGFDRSWAERGAISFYGIRGIGTFYYLAFALNQAPFRNPETIWALAGLTVLVSTVVGGFTATPILEERVRGESPEIESAPG